jgi:XTP/dITP diphosphohydrolase
MQRSYDLLGNRIPNWDVSFVTSNVNKYEEAEKILAEFGIKLGHWQRDLIEIQDDSLRKIAVQKAQDAYNQIEEPLIVEDDGLFIDSLSGFPGPFSSYVFKTIGNDGILKMIGDNRDAQCVSIIVFRDAHSYTSFESKVAGTISNDV